MHTSAVDSGIIIHVVGIPRLVELCTDPLQRNHSDNVLLACLVISFYLIRCQVFSIRSLSND